MHVAQCMRTYISRNSTRIRPGRRIRSPLSGNRSLGGPLPYDREASDSRYRPSPCTVAGARHDCEAVETFYWRTTQESLSVPISVTRHRASPIRRRPQRPTVRADGRQCVRRRSGMKRTNGPFPGQHVKNEYYTRTGFSEGDE